MKKRKIILSLVVIGFIVLSCNQSIKRKTSEKELLSKANVYYEIDDYVNAEIYFDSLILINPFNGEYYFKRGYSASILLDTTSAFSNYKMAINYGYRKESAYLNIGVIYFNKNLFGKSIPFFNKCLELNPNNVKANNFRERALQKISSQ